MIIFWLVCAILVAIALAFIIPTLLERSDDDVNEQGRKEANIGVYRDQLSELEADVTNGIISPEQYQQDRDEIERRVLEDVTITGKVFASKPAALTGRGPIYAIALAIPLVAIAVYLRIGNPAAISASTAAVRQTPFADGAQPGTQMTQQGIEANVAALARRLEQNPSDVQGWTMLARSYVNLEKYSEASNAYSKATALKPDDADLWADYAFAMAMANGRRLQGPPLELVNRALELDPQNAKALELAGSAAFEARKFKEAIDYWQRLLRITPPNSELAQLLLQRINEAKSLAGSGPS
jgi:cytochrome c-type biogenesis protein CcmH